MKKSIHCFNRFIIFTLVFVLAGSLFSQSFSIHDRSVGLILSGSKILGTGFIYGSGNQIITCAHVVFDQDQVQYRTTDGGLYELEITKMDTVGDIAYLISENEICERPLEPGNINAVMNGDKIFYIGFDSKKSKELGNKSLLANQSMITASGEQLNFKGNAKFIEFVGVGKPGYSGGPVFDWNGKLIGLMREAWQKRDLRGGGGILINRAFLINL